MGLTPEELVRANRFESLGLLAGGIANDFNNLLTTILGGLSLAKDSRDPSGLAEAEEACLAAKNLTKQLLTFAKGGTGALTVCDSKEILEEAVKIASAGSTAEITVQAPAGTGAVKVDRAQILQVFQNLILNSLQAMPPQPHSAAAAAEGGGRPHRRGPDRVPSRGRVRRVRGARQRERDQAREPREDLGPVLHDQEARHRPRPVDRDVDRAQVRRRDRPAVDRRGGNGLQRLPSHSRPARGRAGPPRPVASVSAPGGCSSWTTTTTSAP